jgi:hypothetical protein
MMGFFLAALLAILIAKALVYNVPESRGYF